MKKVLNQFSIAILLLALFPTIVNANIVCNDGTISPSCTDCHRGCCSHHGGCSSASNSSSSSGKTSSSSSSSSSTNKNSNSSTSKKPNNTIQNSTPKEEPKSKDISLKSVTIDREDIEVSDNMSYTTTKEKASIYVVANDNKATLEYDNTAELVIGDNLLKIKVTAENGDVKEYKLNITREKILSGNTNIKIMIDDKEIVFGDYVATKIHLANSKDKIDLKYELEDDSTKVEIIGNENLKVGDNEVIIRVKAENGNMRDYIIKIDKYGKFEEIVLNFITTILVVLFYGGVGYLVYRVIKFTKKRHV